MSDEEYVRANWEAPSLVLVYGHLKIVTPQRVRGNGLIVIASVVGTEAEAWAAAAAFTRERKEQIRQVKRDISWLESNQIQAQEDLCARMMKSAKLPVEPKVQLLAIVGRILARLESALADLKRGMKA